VQPVLGLPEISFTFSLRVLLPPPQFAAQVGPMAIGPGSLDKDAPKMCVARLGDGAAPDPLATRVLARDHKPV